MLAGRLSDKMSSELGYCVYAITGLFYIFRHYTHHRCYTLPSLHKVRNIVLITCQCIPVLFPSVSLKYNYSFIAVVFRLYGNCINFISASSLIRMKNTISPSFLFGYLIPSKSDVQFVGNLLNFWTNLHKNRNWHLRIWLIFYSLVVVGHILWQTAIYVFPVSAKNHAAGCYLKEAAQQLYLTPCGFW